MARNEEKAQSMLGRYLRSRRGEGTRERRPYLATLCDDVDEAEKWRLQVLRDIRRQVEEIQNPGLDETKATELNDNINKLLRERGHWERRIKFLGGADHFRKRRGKGDFGDDVFEHNGYFYFGVARNLPGVQELVERERNVERKDDDGESATSLLRRLNVEYFGYFDEHDETLLEAELEAEESGRAKLVKEWEQEHKHMERNPDVPWDESYLTFIDKKPTNRNEEDLEALMLQRKKAEAIEQLEGGAKQQRP